MKTKTKSEIREAERKKLQKYFDSKYKYLTDDVERYRTLYHKALEDKKKYCAENSELKLNNENLIEENRQLKDWVERLQEFVDIPADQRSKAVQAYIDSVKNKANLNALTETYCRIFSTVFQ